MDIGSENTKIGTYGRFMLLNTWTLFDPIEYILKIKYQSIHINWFNHTIKLSKSQIFKTPNKPLLLHLTEFWRSKEATEVSICEERVRSLWSTKIKDSRVLELVLDRTTIHDNYRLGLESTKFKLSGPIL